MEKLNIRLILLLSIWWQFDHVGSSNVDRDIILMPDRSLQVPGKVMFYEPKPSKIVVGRLRKKPNNNNDEYIVEPEDKYSWLNPLKHALFAMLNNKINHNETKSDAINKEDLLNAEFIGLDEENAINKRFGDVINLATGRLEFDGNANFRIVEQIENCVKRCWDDGINDGHNVTAFWSVYRIRHRDEKRQFRYEWKIMIKKLENQRFDIKRNTNNGDGDRDRDRDRTVVRSFILRDQDYPEFFSNDIVDERRHDKGVGTEEHQRYDTGIRVDESQGGNKGVRMEKRLFNTNYDRFEVPFKVADRSKFDADQQEFTPKVENLNTGEYYANDAHAQPSHIPKSSNPVRFYERPTENYLAQEQLGNLHHHYFLNKQEVPILKTTQYEKVTAYPTQSLVSPSYSNAVQHATQIQVPIHKIQQHAIDYPHPHQSILPSSQTAVHFPDEYHQHQQSFKFEPTARSRHRGPYDDNRESILEGEQQNDFKHTNIPQYSLGPKNVDFHASLLQTTPRQQFPYTVNTSPITSVFPGHQSNYNHYPLGLQSDYNRQFLNQLYHFDSTNLRNSNVDGHKLNFAASYPYKDNSYSELDPIYHHSTPISVIKYGGTTENFSPASVQYTSSDELPTSTENYHSTFDSTELSQTTPFNLVDTPTIPTGYYQSEFNANRPDSINAQLPPPDTTDSHEPSIESQDLSQLEEFKRNDKSHSKSDQDSSTGVQIEQLNVTELEPSTEENQLSTRYTTEKNTNAPTQKTSWKPKRSRFRHSEKVKEKSGTDASIVKTKSYPESRRKKMNREKSSTSRPRKPHTEEIITDDATTTTASYRDDETSTSQSVRKSFSVHIGEKITVLPNKEKKVINEKGRKTATENRKRKSKNSNIDKE